MLTDRCPRIPSPRSRVYRIHSSARRLFALAERIDMRRDVLPLLKGEGWGEVWSISGKVTHLTLSLSFQERGPMVPATCVSIVGARGWGMLALLGSYPETPRRRARDRAPGPTTRGAHHAS